MCSGVTTADNNVAGNLDPLFVSPVIFASPGAAVDMRLQAGSPVINKGDDGAAVGLLDLGGSSRFVDAVDLGAYEYFDPALPVELLSFTGIAAGKRNLLRWETALEIGVDRFVLERSEDGRDFTTLGTVMANNRSSRYELVDHIPASTTYYRLRMADLDGTESVSQIILLENKAWAREVSLFPNPTNGMVYLRTADNHPIRTKVYNGTGQLLLESNEFEVDLAAFPAGVYLLDMEDLETGVLQRSRVVRR